MDEKAYSFQNTLQMSVRDGCCGQYKNAGRDGLFLYVVAWHYRTQARYTKRIVSRFISGISLCLSVGSRAEAIKYERAGKSQPK